ncbi:peptidoglycan DD-metalloendopeptidase family protein [Chitinophaga oryzae]|uniref:Peptidoglycan DD-metalloendopeptidase family protein n=1 Tax=Chitinophaga oryzae TaxID=2725414 RepID=A0AAE6ZL85_9BACT|nr:peptidoglycan DD-metalloendopeptidase family protein [Chitinophaga oryzae]QJB34003.1 peptidoglycan DD-metalloendopeptidase family protein [Chitinophaga oryzae]QJB40531.1 peptidoglycan DD-metalloendopeptidase family protein [Chitinophaga oryzae]
MKKLIPILIACWLLPGVLYAQRGNKTSRAALESRKKELQKEIQEATRALQNTRRSTKQNLGLQRELQQKIDSRNAQIKNINIEINQLDGAISSTNDNVQTLEKEVDSLRARYAQLVVYAYKTKREYDVLNFLFSATSFNDALRRYQYLRQYRENRRRQAESLLSTKVLLAQKLENLEQERTRKAGVLYSEQKQRGALIADKKETDQTIVQLQQQEKELQQNIQKSRAEARQVDRAIQDAIRREIEAARKRELAAAAARKRAAAAKAAKRRAEQEAARKRAIAAAKKAGRKPPPPPKPVADSEEEEAAPAAKEDVLAATPEALSLSRDFEANRGRLPWPVDAGRITGRFGTSTVGKVEVEHNGIVIATAKGAAVKAIFDGEVIMVFSVPGAGYMVTLRHGRYFTNYVRLVDVNVRKGMSVKRGHVLGAAAASALAGNGEIELQIYRNMVQQNPERWIRSR